MTESGPTFWPFPVMPAEQRTPQHDKEIRFLNEALAAGYRPCKYYESDYRIESAGGRHVYLTYRGRNFAGTRYRWEVVLNEAAGRVMAFWVDEFTVAADAAFRWLRDAGPDEITVAVDGHVIRGNTSVLTPAASVS